MKKYLIIIGLVAIGSFSYWTLSPLFIDKTVDDALPTVVSLESESKLQKIIETMPDVTMNDPMPQEVRLITTPTIRNDVEENSAIPSSSPIEDTPGHPAAGNIKVLNTGEETIVRYESYDGTNGPDLFVYLATDLDATEFVSLGRSKGNQGNANYSVPDDVDISNYKYVMTWCKAFGVLFDYAEIN